MTQPADQEVEGGGQPEETSVAAQSPGTESESDISARHSAAAIGDPEPPSEASFVERAGSPLASQGAPAEEAPRRKRPIFLDFDLLQLAGIVFLLDQLTKFLVRAYLPFGYSYPATGFFRFTHAENTGSAFGILQGFNTPLIVVSFVGIFVLAMIYQSQPRPTNLLRLSLALQIGGAVGNLLDRFRLGAVTDFIDVGPWPIFNLADSSIICGLVLLGWILLRPASRQAEADGPATIIRDYTLKRRGRCARCYRLHSGRRSPCRQPLTAGRSGRRLTSRAYRR